MPPCSAGQPTPRRLVWQQDELGELAGASSVAGSRRPRPGSVRVMHASKTRRRKSSAGHRKGLHARDVDGSVDGNLSQSIGNINGLTGNSTQLLANMGKVAARSLSERCRTEKYRLS